MRTSGIDLERVREGIWNARSRSAERHLVPDASDGGMAREKLARWQMAEVCSAVLVPFSKELHV